VSRRRSQRQKTTVAATADQLVRWGEAARRYNRELPAFLAFAGDAVARYLRELHRTRSRPDPVLFRREEKRRLEALVRAAKAAARSIPAPASTPHFLERHDPAGDLRRAIGEVEAFWEQHGEAFGI
jgi:aminoglycoside phosphotransferase (APT) family kinase protein